VILCGNKNTPFKYYKNKIKTPIFITPPVGFSFYMPDPTLKQWSKEDERLKKAGVIKK